MNNVSQAAEKALAPEVRTTVAQKLWQLQVFLNAAGIHEQSELAFSAIKQLQAEETAVEPWFYYADCADQDYSCLCNNLEDAQTAVNDHGGVVQLLWNVAPDRNTKALKAKIAQLQADLETDRTMRHRLVMQLNSVQASGKPVPAAAPRGPTSLYAEIEYLQKTIVDLSRISNTASALIAHAKELKARNDELQSAWDRCADAAWLLYDGNFYDQPAIMAMSPHAILRTATAYAGYKPAMQHETLALPTPGALREAKQ